MWQTGREVSWPSSIAGNFAIGGNLSVGGTLAVTGTSAFTGASTFTGAVTLAGGVAGNLVATGNVVATATLYGATLSVASGAFDVDATGRVQAGAGVVGDPGYAFSGDPDTGWWLSNVAEVTTSIGGVATIVYDAAGVKTVAGAVGTPAYSFIGDPNTGLYNVAADSLGIATNGVLRLSVTTAAVVSTLPISNALGAVATPAYSFTGDLNTGMYSSGADVIDFATNGVNRLSIGNAQITSSVTVSVSACTYTSAGVVQANGNSSATIKGNINAGGTGWSANSGDVQALATNNRSAGSVFGVYNNNGAARLWNVGWDGRVYSTVPNSGPTDADLGNSMVTWYVDQTAHTLIARVKYSDGTTLKTATIALA